MICALHFTGPIINITVYSTNSTCIVNWTVSGLALNYTVIWINLIINMTNYDEVLGNSTGYTITNLNTNAMYIVSVNASFMCGGTVASDNYTINSEWAYD